MPKSRKELLVEISEILQSLPYVDLLRVCIYAATFQELNEEATQ